MGMSFCRQEGPWSHYPKNGWLRGAFSPHSKDSRAGLKNVVDIAFCVPEAKNMMF